MRKFKCSICGYIYDESKGIPEKGIPPGTKWENLPDDFICPVCSAPRSVFKQEETPAAQTSNANSGNNQHQGFKNHDPENLLELSAEEISAICSSLAKGCEKQRLNPEMEAFIKIADYFKSKAAENFAYGEKDVSLNDAAEMLDYDLTKGYAAANEAAKANSLQGSADRGALRSLVWSEKVSAMGKALLERFEKEGEAMLANTKIFVCDICGFIYLGDIPPDICPVCKVPKHKLLQIERRLS
jgi:rubredoxin